MKKLLVLVLAVSLGAGAASAALAAGKVLKVGSDVAYPPFEYANEKTKEYEGFDIDFINAIGKYLGYSKVEVINTAWDGLIPGLMNGNYDCIISAMTITEERAKSVDFSDPYFEAGQAVVVRKSDTSVKTKDDLKGKVVSVQLGTTGDFAVTEMKGLKKVARFNTSPEALQEVLNGAADAAVVDDLVAIEFVKKNPDRAKVAVKKFTVEFYGIAIRKGNKQLLADVNKAIAALKKDGTYDKIYQKWFGDN
ncbi:MAG: basic amino acid ABC transporter substrate-binding protein [Bacillota bacterium]|nr:basic amino acid ABC transporter substrate-binding protein [Bacillota bacterium]